MRNGAHGRLRGVLGLLVSLLLFTSCGEEPAEGTGAVSSSQEEETADTADQEEHPLPEILESLQGEEAARAAGMVGACVARLDVSGGDAAYYGSALLWDSLSQDGGETVILVTAGHLLELGEEYTLTFADGYLADAVWLGSSGEADVGFLSVSWEETFLSVQTRLDPAAEDSSAEEEADTASREPALVSLHQRIYDTLDEWSSLLIAASSEEGAGDVVASASLMKRSVYREEFSSNVMILKAASGTGMSGGGAFDGYAHCIGMIVGGSGEQTAVLGMETLNAAYLEICGRERDTEPYRNAT